MTTALVSHIRFDLSGLDSTSVPAALVEKYIIYL
jgi:hypothetical protein